MRLHVFLLCLSLFLPVACSRATNPGSDGVTPGAEGNTQRDASAPDSTSPDTGPQETAPTPDASPQERDPQSDTTVQPEPTGQPDTTVQPEAAPEQPAGPDVPATGAWRSAAPLAVSPRQETAVVAFDSKIYVIGGFDNRARVVATVEAYDPKTQAWERITDLPQIMHHANAAALGGKLYVIGYLVGLQFREEGRIFVYDPTTKKWSEQKPMPQGSARGSSGVGVIQNKIYLVGGLQDRKAVTSLSSYDPATETWKQLAPLPAPIDHMATAAVQNKLYVLGGRNTSIGSHTPQVHIYDPTTNAWTQGASMPTSRGGTAAAALGNTIYVFGGEGNSQDPSGVYPQSEAYDTTNNTWRTLAPMKTPRHGTGAASLDGLIYVPGGATVQAFGAVSTVEIFIPPR